MDKNVILKELESIKNYKTPIVELLHEDNNIYLMREDMIPFSFGGNKCRIAARYFEEIMSRDFDAVVTYGASSSNLCRVIANFAYKYGKKCIIISPEENYIQTPNSEMVKMLGAEIIKCPLGNVPETIDSILARLRKDCNPYFIYGGGHGVLGTDSYRNVLRQITCFEKLQSLSFDYIFITLATGTSMSGLIVENEVRKLNKKIIGISIARDKDRAMTIMDEALKAYNESYATFVKDADYEIIDDYRCDGYATYNNEVLETIRKQFMYYGVNLDTTYTGKGFWGMTDILHKRKVTSKNVLFIHTGGTPLFFIDNCKKFNN